ncbi:hypothetical protein CAEBREN_15587 [Caenorhabditis brenneri]|uniref:Uncharacterized protein n=1 Tax=Caenorhabditis brenneri TaxID=135651 RepID=G0PDF6_CAEBE|nr:hypothetical protein CAEBREN_15587 [Caenorhabditis brenneri]
MTRQKDPLAGVILSPALERRLRYIAITTSNTKRNNELFRNVMFYGPPGTGQKKCDNRRNSKLAKANNVDKSLEDISKTGKTEKNIQKKLFGGRRRGNGRPIGIRRRSGSSGGWKDLDDVNNVGITSRGNVWLDVSISEPDETFLFIPGVVSNQVQDDSTRSQKKSFAMEFTKEMSRKEDSRKVQPVLLQKDTHELRCLREYLMLALEAIMHNHREMMVNYVKTVREQPRQIPQSSIDSAMERANTRTIDASAQMTLAVDESIAREEIRSENRQKLKKSIETETLLMRMMFEMEDIREAKVADLVALWRSHQRPPAAAAKPPVKSRSRGEAFP